MKNSQKWPKREEISKNQKKIVKLKNSKIGNYV